MGTRLFVGNLSYNTNELGLREVFEEGGRRVVEVKIVTDRETGRSRGFAFVEMGSAEDAGAVTAELNGRLVDGRPINVSEARAKTPRAPTGWSDGPRGGYGGGDRGGYNDRGGYSAGGERDYGGGQGQSDAYESRGRGRGNW